MTNTPDDSRRPPAELGYAGALAELDLILNELDSADVDVDVLAERVTRASELIAFCRGRIDHARLTIDDVVSQLDGGADAAASES